MRRRQGEDTDPVVLTARRIYILPTNLGLGFAGMLFLMLTGAMNYANNLALALAFLLGALALVAMHHAHRNLVGLKVASGSVEPVFAGQPVGFRIALENEARLARPELVIRHESETADPVRLHAGERSLARTVIELRVPTQQRGRRRLDRFEVATTYPFGLFRAWAVLHMPIDAVVYPRPSERGITPPPLQTDVGGAQDAMQGEEEFAGLRPFHPGDSPRRIVWKAYAREQGLHVTQYGGTAVSSHVFSWDMLAGLGTEERLSQLCRWVIDAHAAGRAYGLRLPGVTLDVNMGAAHRQRCLTALALFETPT